MNMKKEFIMNKFSGFVIAPAIKYLFITAGVLLMTACADSRIVTLETSVKQLQNLSDDDRDGVVKAREKCEKTTFGAAIDNDGCGTQTAANKPFKIKVNFENNSSEVPLTAFAEIQSLAEFLAKHPEITLVIEGHSSKIGSAKFNKKLSSERAKAVASMLVSDFKIDQNRISSIGYGFERLAVTGESEQAHAENRRIMAEVSHTEYIDDLKWTIYTVDLTD